MGPLGIVMPVRSGSYSYNKLLLSMKEDYKKKSYFTQIQRKPFKKSLLKTSHVGDLNISHNKFSPFIKL